MTIVRHSDGAGLATTRGASEIKPAAAKHAGKKVAGKQAAKKVAAKHAVGKKSTKLHTMQRPAPPDDDVPADCDMGAAYHHLHRAGAVISLLEADSGADLRSLLEHGIELYRGATGQSNESSKGALCASGLLRATEHLAMAGLYAARKEYRADVQAPALLQVQHHLDTLDARLDGVKTRREKDGLRLLSMARMLVKRALSNHEDPHLRYELVMAADGICSALEAGLKG